MARPAGDGPTDGGWLPSEGSPSAPITLMQRSQPLDPSRKEDLQERTRRLEHKYGYEVLAGAPRMIAGDHPVHAWNAPLEDAPEDSSGPRR